MKEKCFILSFCRLLNFIQSFDSKTYWIWFFRNLKIDEIDKKIPTILNIKNTINNAKNFLKKSIPN